MIYLLPPLLLVFPFSAIARGGHSTAAPANSGYELHSRGAAVLGPDALDNCTHFLFFLWIVPIFCCMYVGPTFIMHLTLLLLTLVKFSIFNLLTGICMVKQIVCLVIDEAHRASKNFAYCIAIREACFKYLTHLFICTLQSYCLSVFSSVIILFFLIILVKHLC